MRFTNIITVLWGFSIALNGFAVCDTVLHCTTKSGCQTTLCDPVPAKNWNEPDLELEEHLQNRAFPILCKSNKENEGIELAQMQKSLRDMSMLIVQVTKELQDQNYTISALKQYINQLQKENRDKTEELKELQKSNLKLEKADEKLRKDIRRLNEKVDTSRFNVGPTTIPSRSASRRPQSSFDDREIWDSLFSGFTRRLGNPPPQSSRIPDEPTRMSNRSTSRNSQSSSGTGAFSHASSGFGNSAGRAIASSFSGVSSSSQTPFSWE